MCVGVCVCVGVSVGGLELPLNAVMLIMSELLWP